MSEQTTTSRIFRYLCDFTRGHGYPPSQRQISEACYVGRTTVNKHLARLVEQGFISREHGMARGITILRACEQANVRMPDTEQIELVSETHPQETDA